MDRRRRAGSGRECRMLHHDGIDDRTRPTFRARVARHRGRLIRYAGRWTARNLRDRCSLGRATASLLITAASEAAAASGASPEPRSAVGRGLVGIAVPKRAAYRGLGGYPEPKGASGPRRLTFRTGRLGATDAGLPGTVVNSRSWVRVAFSKGP
jgi:hypothetical protein